MEHFPTLRGPTITILGLPDKVVVVSSSPATAAGTSIPIFYLFPASQKPVPECVFFRNSTIS